MPRVDTLDDDGHRFETKVFGRISKISILEYTMDGFSGEMKKIHPSERGQGPPSSHSIENYVRRRLQLEEVKSKNWWVFPREDDRGFCAAFGVQERNEGFVIIVSRAA